MCYSGTRVQLYTHGMSGGPQGSVLCQDGVNICVKYLKQSKLDTGHSEARNLYNSVPQLNGLAHEALVQSCKG